MNYQETFLTQQDLYSSFHEDDSIKNAATLTSQVIAQNLKQHSLALVNKKMTETYYFQAPKKWKKDMQRIKIGFPENPLEYYQNLPARPGTHFYAAMVESPVDISQVPINIPDTIYIGLDPYWLTNDLETGIKEMKTKDFVLINFYHHLRELDVQNYQKGKLDMQEASVIEKMTSEDNQTSHFKILSWSQFNNRLNQRLPEGLVLQKFMYSEGYRAQLFRVQYYNPVYISNKRCFALQMTNKEKQQVRDLKYNTLRPDISFSFDIYKVTDAARLSSFLEYSEVLVQYIYKSFGMKVQSCVIDFIRDINGKIWMVDLKNFIIVNHSSVIQQNILRETNPRKLEKLRREKEKLSQMSLYSYYCYLCKSKFKKQQLNKTVTIKMLAELIKHLCKRGIFIFDHVDVSNDILSFQVNKNHIDSTRVCEVCYSLVVAEHQLIEIEKLYAQALSIPLREGKNKENIPQTVKRVSSDSFAEKLMQWRILFYFQDFWDITAEELINAAATAGGGGGNNNNNGPPELYLQLKLQDFITPFRIDFSKHMSAQEEDSFDFGMGRNERRQFGTPTRQQLKKHQHQQRQQNPQLAGGRNKTKDTQSADAFLFDDHNTNTSITIVNERQKKAKMFNLNKMRVHYFFTEKNVEIKEFLINTEVELRITRGLDWNKPIAIANGFPLQYFQPNEHGSTADEQDSFNFTQRQPIQLHFFGKKMKTFFIKGTIGLKRDIEIESEKLQLYKYGLVYFPQNSYYNSDELPFEWLELVERSAQERKARAQSGKRLTTDFRQSFQSNQSHNALIQSISRSPPPFSSTPQGVQGIQEQPNIIVPGKTFKNDMDIYSEIAQINFNHLQQVEQGEDQLKHEAFLQDDEEVLHQTLSTLGEREKMVAKLRSNILSSEAHKNVHGIVQSEAHNRSVLEVNYDPNQTQKQRKTFFNRIIDINGNQIANSGNEKTPGGTEGPAGLLRKTTIQDRQMSKFNPRVRNKSVSNPIVSQSLAQIHSKEHNTLHRPSLQTISGKDDSFIEDFSESNLTTNRQPIAEEAMHQSVFIDEDQLDDPATNFLKEMEKYNKESNQDKVSESVELEQRVKQIQEQQQRPQSHKNQQIRITGQDGKYIFIQKKKRKKKQSVAQQYLKLSRNIKDMPKDLNKFLSQTVQEKKRINSQLLKTYGVDQEAEIQKNIKELYPNKKQRLNSAGPSRVASRIQVRGQSRSKSRGKGSPGKSGISTRPDTAYTKKTPLLPPGGPRSQSGRRGESAGRGRNSRTFQHSRQPSGVKLPRLNSANNTIEFQTQSTVYEEEL